MGGRNSRFFHELTPLANALRAVCTTPAGLVKPRMTFAEEADASQKEWGAARAKHAEKLARRAARAGFKVAP